jgi:hypothetical protein
MKKENHLPKEYEFFCKMQKVVGCSYLKSPYCPKTCNLSALDELLHDIEIDYKDVLGGKNEI